MFGYLKVYEDELKIREWKRYRQYYCSLCKQMGIYSQMARFMLSYDMVFFLMLMDCELSEKLDGCVNKCMRGCRKKDIGEDVEYMAAVSVILLYHKLNNDVLDGRRIKKILMALISSGYRKAKSDYPDIAEIVEERMDKLYKLESEKCSDFDKLEECFVEIFRLIYTTRKSMNVYDELRGDISYHIGAWVYWFDMCVDVQKDKEKGDFNAILQQKDLDLGKKKVIKKILEHLEDAERMIKLLPYSDNNIILQNIVKYGLLKQMEEYGI